MADPKTKALFKKIGKKLKHLRKKKGYTSYVTFASDHKFKRHAYWRVESGSTITLTSLMKVLKAHRLSLKKFFSDFD
jgi:hypothetical protein